MDKDEQYILDELAYAVERNTWFELGGHLSTKLQAMLKSKDAEIERLREALESISKIPNSESAYGIIQTFVIDALNEKEKSNDGQPTEQEEWRDFDPDC